MKSKIKCKIYIKTCRKTQGGNFTISSKVKIGFFLPYFSETKTVTWKFPMDDSSNSSHDMILGRDLLTSLVIDIKFSQNTISGGEGPYNGCTVRTYGKFK